MNDTILKKKNIILKTLNINDYSLRYYNWLEDKRVNKYLETRFKKNTKKDIINFIKHNNKSQDVCLFGIFIDNLSTSNHIGNIKIGPINFNHKYAYVSYFIGDIDFWGKGYATLSVNIITSYAFKKLKLNKCLAGVYASNKGSIKVLKNNGYVKEANFKSQLLINNKYEDEYVYSCYKSLFKKI